MSVTRIQAEAQKADEMIAELGRQQAADASEHTGEPANDDPEGGDGAAVDQGTAEVSSVQDEGGAHEDEAEASSTPDEELRKELETERQRYRSLQGMIRKRDEQINQLHEMLASMHQAREQAPAPQEDGKSLLTSEDSQNFGDDMVDMARRAARQEMQTIEKQLDEIRRQIQGVSKTTQQFTEQSFEQQLDQLTENRWRELDTDPLFMDWLKANRYRTGMFQQALSQRDAHAVADVFNEYSREQTQAQAKQEAPKQKRQDQLQKQVAPGKSRSTGTAQQDQSEPKEWTRSEIASVYANSKQYTKEDFERLEREIAAAQKAGRVDFSR